MSNPYLSFYNQANQKIQDKIKAFPNDYASSYWERRDGVVNYSWAIPNEEVLKEIAKYSPIVEMGAGGGFWTQQLRKFGVNITPFDQWGCQTKYNRYVNKIFVKVHRGSPKILRKAKFKNHTLLLCWPPYNTSMASDSLNYFRGNTICYIGEGGGGCTGNDAFHNKLETDFEEIKHIEIPKWDGLYDSLMIYQRI